MIPDVESQDTPIAEMMETLPSRTKTEVPPKQIFRDQWVRTQPREKVLIVHSSCYYASVEHSTGSARS